MTIKNEAQPQHLDMMQADIAGTDNISWGSAAKGLGQEAKETAGALVNKQTLALAAATALLIATHGDANAAELAKGITQKMGLGISEGEAFKIALEVISWIPLVLGAPSFIAGAIQGREIIRDPGFNQRVNEWNGKIKAKANEVYGPKAEAAVRAAIARGEIKIPPDPKTGKTPEKIDINSYVQTTIQKMVDDEMKSNPLVIKPIVGNRQREIEVSTRLGMVTLRKIVIPGMFATEVIIAMLGALTGTPTPGIGAPIILTTGLLSIGEIMDTINVDPDEEVFKGVTPTRKKQRHTI